MRGPARDRAQRARNRGRDQERTQRRRERPGDEAVRGVAEIDLVGVDFGPRCPQPPGDEAADRRGDHRDDDEVDAGRDLERGRRIRRTRPTAKSTRGRAPFRMPAAPMSALSSRPRLRRLQAMTPQRRPLLKSLIAFASQPSRPPIYAASIGSCEVCSRSAGRAGATALPIRFKSHLFAAERIGDDRAMTELVAAAPSLTARDARDFPTLGEAFRVWLRIALLSFGGPAGQIAVMHRILVEEKRWICEQPLPARAELLHAAAGPGGAAARDLYRLADAPDARRADRRRRCSSLPGVVAIMALSWIYARLRQGRRSSRRCSSG